VPGGTLAQEDMTSGLVSPVATDPLPTGAHIIAHHWRPLPSGAELFAYDTAVLLPDGTTTARPGDVVQRARLFDLQSGQYFVSYSLMFDAKANGLPDGTMTDAVAVADNGDLLLSFDTTVTLGGSTFKPQDLVRFNGTTFSLFFDGTAAGIADGINLDGAQLLSNGHLLLSFDISGTVGGVTFRRADILEYDPSGHAWEKTYDSAALHPEWAAAKLVAFYAVPVVVNGACGTANGQMFTGAPTGNLCSAGDPSAVSGTGPWTWQCTSSSGGSTASCSASLQTYTINFSAGPNGNLEIPAGVGHQVVSSTSQTVAYGGSTTTPVSAVPNANYHFVNWTDSTTGAPYSSTTPLIINNVTASLSLTANFAGMMPSYASLSASATSIVVGDTITFTAAITPPGGTGQITFTDGASTLGTASLNSGGVAQLVVSNLAVGTHTIGAAYGGDANYLASTANSLTITVTVPGPPVVFSGVQSVIPTTGLYHPWAVTADSAGNVYVASQSSHGPGGSVVKIAAGTGVQTTLATVAGYPSGIAVDQAGNVYVTDFNNDLVMRVPVDGGTPTTIANNLAMPYGLAVDTTGNVYIADSNEYFVLKVPGSGLCSGIYYGGVRASATASMVLLVLRTG
jgi:hypothetical protein